MRKINPVLSKNSFSILSVGILISVLFLPFIKPFEKWPGVELIDLLVPFLFVLFTLKWGDVKDRKIYYLLGGFALYILLTIAINSRWGYIRDYFEVFKMVKFMLIIWLFSYTTAEDFIKKWSKPIFVALVVFNFIHYFELFNFNDLLEHYYQAGERLPTFGKNSIGQPTDKRMLGFPCNPNYNSIVFLFFTVLFIPRKEKETPISKWDYFWYALALLMVFLCQSRTSFPVIGIILLIHAVLYLKSSWQMIVTLVLLSAFSYGVSYKINELSLDYRLSEYNNSVYDDSPMNFNGIMFRDSSTLIYNDNDTVVIDSILTAQELIFLINVTYPSYIDSLSAVKNKKNYMGTMLDGSAFESHSFSERIVIWKHLWGMIKQKPIFGHGPAKEYFYENNLYSENEYILITWRYGFIGLLLFVTLLGKLLLIGWKLRHTKAGLIVLYFTLVFGISGMTNNPFTHQMLIVLLAATAGWAIGVKKKGAES